MALRKRTTFSFSKATTDAATTLKNVFGLKYKDTYVGYVYLGFIL